MELFEKRNRRATPRSIIRAACTGAGSCFIFALVILIGREYSFWGWVFMLPYFTIVGGAVGA